MTYEEKRELRLQISQMLSDAGLNQKTIKDMVEEEIQNKVERAVNQCLKSLDSECSSGDYVSERIRKLLMNTYLNQATFDRVVKEELKNRVIQVVLKDCEKDG
jgi:flagellar biosynthesis/type III secretory pathway protein FliH